MGAEGSFNSWHLIDTKLNGVTSQMSVTLMYLTPWGALLEKLTVAQPVKKLHFIELGGSLPRDTVSVLSGVDGA